MKSKKIFLAAVLLIAGLFITACGDDIKYGSIQGKATGSIDFTSEVPEVLIDNIQVEMGEEIDYTSEIEVAGADGLSNYQVSVNASQVNTEEPGTYIATYTITYDNNTYTKQVTVSVKDNSQNSNSTTTQQTTQQTTTRPATSTNTTTTSAAQNQTTTATTTQAIGVPTAKIQLLSGEVVSINLTNSKYIVSTRTDVSEVTRNGIKYSVEKLIITYNTGTEQILETIEKKIS